jgi:outer membrane immunogenic protein
MKKLTTLSILLIGTTLLADTTTNWAGNYYGVSLNYNHGTVENSSNISAGNYYTGNDIELITPHSSNNNSDNNIGATFSLGHNIQIENVVYGLETDLSLANYSNEYNSGNIFYDTMPTKTFNVHTKLSHDWIINLQPKIGYAYNSSLFYAVGGLSLAQFKYEFDKTDNAFNAAIHQDSNKFKIGFNVGVGIEHQISKDWTLSLEYLYTKFNNVAKENGTLHATGGLTANYDNSVDYKLNTLSIGFIKRF